MRLPGVRAAMKAAADRMAGLAGGPEPGNGVSWVVAEAYDAGGAQLARAELSGPEPYGLTADLIAWAAQQRVEGTGALGPVEAYGVDALQEGCRKAGLERVSAA
jgi:hypothetical protein